MKEEEEEEEEEEFLTIGNWRGKHNSLSRATGAERAKSPACERRQPLA